MKLPIYMLLIFAISTSCQSGQRDSAATEQLTATDFSWLEGHWVRTNNAEGSLTSEVWERSGPKQWTGIGRTLKDGKVSFEEVMTIAQMDTGWALTVTGVNDDPTEFQLTHVNENSFTAEKPDHDFPTLIRYELVGVELNAIVMNDDHIIEFKFDRKDSI